MMTEDVFRRKGQEGIKEVFGRIGVMRNIKKILRRPQMLFGDYDLEKLVKRNHPLREMEKIISFEKLAYLIKDCVSELGRNGYGLEMGLKGIFLQFYLDLSDREFEDRLRYDISLKWFCRFSLEEPTPDHTFLCRIRKKIGTKRIGKIFRKINEEAGKSGYIGNVFSFIDASAIEAKESTWEQRDKAIKAGEEKLNNENVAFYSADPDARSRTSPLGLGAKGKINSGMGTSGICVRIRERV